MDIFYLGHSSFRLKGKIGTVVTDPFADSIGKYPKDVEATLVTVSHDHDDHNAVDKIPEAKFQIVEPGEYEVGGISVIGVHSFHDDVSGAERGTNTIYVIEIDGLRIAHLGDLGHKLSQDQLDEMGPVDIALVPVGGEYTIDAKTAVEVVRQVDPWVVIPMHYDQPGITVPKPLGSLETFLKEMGKSDIVPVPKYSITSEKLPTELTIVVLEKK